MHLETQGENCSSKTFMGLTQRLSLSFVSHYFHSCSAHGIRTCRRAAQCRRRESGQCWPQGRAYRSERPARDAYPASSHPCWKRPVRNLAKRQSSFPTKSGPDTTHIRTQQTLKAKQTTAHPSAAREKDAVFKPPLRHSGKGRGLTIWREIHSCVLRP